MVFIHEQHKAAVYDEPGKISTTIKMVPTPEPGPGQVLVRLTHSGVCASDLGIMMNTWAGLPFATKAGQVGGHEGVGEVVKLGPGAELGTVKEGDRVGVKWISSACSSCPACLESMDGVCFQKEISGYSTPGTFQQYVLAPSNYVTPIPAGLDSADAAPILCAGLTSYAALRKSNARSGQWVVISGAGGGLGHLACQIASKGMALRVIGLDHGSKEQLVRDSGAEAFFDVTSYDDKEMAKQIKTLTGGLGASAAVVCAGNNKAYAQAANFLRFGGTLVCVGIPQGRPEPIAKAVPNSLIGRELHIVGSAVGNRKEATEVLDLASRGVVKTHYRIEPLENLTKVFEEMYAGQLNGRVVVSLE